MRLVFRSKPHLSHHSIVERLRRQRRRGNLAESGNVGCLPHIDMYWPHWVHSWFLQKRVLPIGYPISQIGRQWLIGGFNDVRKTHLDENLPAALANTMGDGETWEVEGGNGRVIGKGEIDVVVIQPFFFIKIPSWLFRLRLLALHNH